MIISGCLYCSALFRLRCRRRGCIMNIALTKKLTDEFRLFFTDIAYVPEILPIYFFLHQANKRPFSKMAA